MKINKKLPSICLIVLLLKPVILLAQTADCSVNYEKALLLYKSGMADSALSVLKLCIRNNEELRNLSKETRGRIFRLASLSSIMTGNPEEAENYAREMLVYQPDYKNRMDNEDLMEFRLILEKLVPKPSLRFGINAGINFPILKLQKNYSNYILDSARYDLNTSPGFQFGVTVEKTFTKNLSVAAGVGISQVIFDYVVSGLDVLNYDDVQYLYKQKVTSIEIPVLARYNFRFKSLMPYIEAGITGRISLNSMENSEMYGRYWFTNSANSNKILTTFVTDFENFGFLFGGGICYDLNKINLRMNVRYNHFLENSAESSKFDDVNGYEDIGPGERFYYTDDINLLNVKYIQISIGFLYNLSYKVF